MIMKIKKNLFMMSICSLLVLFTSCDTAMAVLAGMAEGMNGYYGGYGMTSSYVPSASSFTSGSSSSSSYSSSSSSTTSNSTSKRRCAYCNGTGRLRKSTSTPTFGQTETKKKCQECGDYYYPSCGHIHVSCGHCGGSGIAK